MDAWIADKRNAKASTIVRYLRAMHRGVSVEMLEILEPADRKLICELAGVRVASDQTWAEVITISRALERDKPRVAVIARDDAELEAVVLALKAFAHNGRPAHVYVVGGDGVARPVFCFVEHVTAYLVEILEIATRRERGIELKNVRAVVDA